MYHQEAATRADFETAAAPDWRQHAAAHTPGVVSAMGNLREVQKRMRRWRDASQAKIRQLELLYE
jgi:hypothetical protein